MYSYKTPRKKVLYDKNSLIWAGFIATISLSLLMFGGYLRYKSSLYRDDFLNVQESNKAMSQSVMSYEKEFKIIKMQNTLAQDVSGSNKLLKNSIKNLFDLVPDQIVLHKVVMEKELLNLEGTTPTKDTNRLLLEPPLKSIFQSSRVTYQFNSGIGRYEFKSVNSVGTEIKEQTDGKK